MKSIAPRLAKLENQQAAKSGDVTLACLNSCSVRDDTTSEGVFAAVVLGGDHKPIRRADYSSDQAFWAAVEKEHIRIHGFGMEGAA